MKFILLLCLFLTPNAYAWDGYDDDDHDIEIEQGTWVRAGEDIEVYDYNDDEYRDVAIESISSYDGIVEIEAYDYDTGEYVTYEMDEY